MPQAEGLALEARVIRLVLRHSDMREGTRAFLEKRAAQFHAK